jgi:hypothetical protein
MGRGWWCTYWWAAGVYVAGLWDGVRTPWDNVTTLLRSELTRNTYTAGRLLDDSGVG